jgi:hypothetical protein
MSPLSIRSIKERSGRPDADIPRAQAIFRARKIIHHKMPPTGNRAIKLLPP